MKLASFSHNTSYHQTIGTTPFELVRGYKARLPVSFETREKLLTYGDYLADLTENLVEAQTLAGLNSIQQKYKSKFYYDRARMVTHFVEGEFVFIVNHSKKNKHVRGSFIGPFQIVKVFPDSQNVQIQIGKLKKQIHINELRRAYQFMGKDNLTINRVNTKDIIP